MSYFHEIEDYKTYSGSDADFHFSYNKNSGGGQSFLGGRFINEENELVSAQTIDEKQAVFSFPYTTIDGKRIFISLDDNRSRYDVKPRGDASTSMKLGIGKERETPSKIISTALMLPLTCGVDKTKNPELSILTAENYWLQSAWLECYHDKKNTRLVSLVLKDLVFSGSNEIDGEKKRYFKLNLQKRIQDIISLSNKVDCFSIDVLDAVNSFSEIFSQKKSFSYSECEQARNVLQRFLLMEYPEEYSGVSDPLPVLMDIAKKQETSKGKLVFRTGIKTGKARNRIFFGAPGTGKSYTVNRECIELIGDGNEMEYERVTFHPDYSYANFVGTYKPIPSIDKENNDVITYAFVPGPFMRMYARALKNSQTDTPKPHLLIIEEINRANVAAVFGDVFQLLDRGSDNVSEYSIQATEDVKKYLATELGGVSNDYNKIRIPDNLFIWATMNSADQGVFPMDTAFKRRWDFTYLGIDDNDELIRDKCVYLGRDRSQKVEWNKLRKAINHFLAKEKINEDKQLGPYFISKNILVPICGDEIDCDQFIDVFKNKVIMYLFEDAGKQKRAKLFEGCPQDDLRYSTICREFDANGIGIFNQSIQIETKSE